MILSLQFSTIIILLLTAASMINGYSNSLNGSKCKYNSASIRDRKINLYSTATVGSNSDLIVSSELSNNNKPFIRSYISSLKAKPISTKSFASAFGFLLGDMIAQTFVAKVK